MVIYHKYTILPHKSVRGSTHSQLVWYYPLWYADSWPHGQQPHPYPQGFSIPPSAVEKARQIGPLLHVVTWSHGQQPHPHTIKEPLPPMDSREERVIQSERTLTWIWFRCHKDYENQIGWSLKNYTWCQNHIKLTSIHFLSNT